MNKEKTITAVKKYCGIDTIHFTVANGDSLHNFKYCTKTRPSDSIPNAVVYEQGDRPVTQREKGEGEQLRWDNIKQLAKENRIGTPMYLPPEIWSQIMAYADDRQVQMRKAQSRSNYIHSVTDFQRWLGNEPHCGCYACVSDEYIEVCQF